jgi:hypothetical protein
MLDLLVQVVPDPRAVCEQMLDGHVVADERKILSEQRSRGRRELEQTVLDEAGDRERRQSLCAARDRELSIDFVGYLLAALREAVRLRDFDPRPAVDPNAPENAVSAASASRSR